jgi:SHS family lactate transporter-like MFS transporter
MEVVDAIRGLTPEQRNTFLASFLGWTLDAFDYFILPLTYASIAADFHAPEAVVLTALTLTLAMRPVGAFIFGALADRFGRRIPLMIDILLFSILELASAFAPTLTVFIILRALFGIAMGGEWGLGAALALESLPAKSRGLFSGLLQQGYAFGYLLAAAVTWLAFAHIGWRGMFILGSLPALLVLFMRSRVPESPVWQKEKHATSVGFNPITFVIGLGKRWPIFLFAIALMTAFNCMSHGTQDLYPRLLAQHGLDINALSFVTIIANLGAITGGTLFGALSQKYGRRKAIVGAALMGLIAAPFWAKASGMALLAVSGFVMQFAVQGAWGVIPAHLTELAPAELRASFPGLSYQLGNLFASASAQFEGYLANGPYHLTNGGADYAKALLVFIVIVLIAVALLAGFGPERRNADFVQETQE